MDAISISALALAGVAFVAAGAALFIASRSTPNRVLGELGALTATSQATSRVAQTATNDVATMQDAWARHRVEVGKLLDEAIDAMEQAERKRKSAHKERARAEEVKDGANDPEPDRFTCPGCEYEHLKGENCVEAAKRRFRAQGLAV